MPGVLGRLVSLRGADVAGDWMPLRTDLRDDEAVISIGLELGIDRDLVVGKLVRFWSWVDGQLDGSRPSIPLPMATIDAIVDHPGFGVAVFNAGWLVEYGDSFEVPNADRWLGKNAKRRLKDRYRKELARANSSTPALDGNFGESVSAKCPHDERTERGLQDIALSARDADNSRKRVRSVLKPSKLAGKTPAEWCSAWNNQRPDGTKATKVLTKKQWRRLAEVVAELEAADLDFEAELRGACAKPLSQFHREWGRVSLRWLLDKAGAMEAFLAGEKSDDAEAGSRQDYYRKKAMERLRRNGGSPF